MNENKKKPVLLSGIQPSGNLMIGNYIGAIKNWVALQKTHDCLFVLVDLHAITVRQNPEDLVKRSHEFLSLYIACGIDPATSAIFVQSHVPDHAELAWILNCYAYMGELRRMTQFKDKAKKQTGGVGVGLFDYPVLMAADILLYQTDLVPVGDDQKQHLELTRTLAQRFNNLYGDVFTVPEPYIPEIGARIASLQDPSSKMSKSDDDPDSYVALLEGPDVTRKKIMSAVTDSGKEIRCDKSKPGIANLITIYSCLTGRTPKSVEEQYEGKGYGQFKSDLADLVIEFLQPIQERYRNVRQDKTGLAEILRSGAAIAAQRSQRTLQKVHDVLGFIPRL